MKVVNAFSKELKKIAIDIRIDVFCEEMKIPYHVEVYKEDNPYPFLLQNDQGKFVGTIRCRETDPDFYTIERLAIYKEYRIANNGNFLFKHALNYLLDNGKDNIIIRPMERLENFYGKYGFERITDIYEVSGVRVLNMKYIKGFKRFYN